MKEQIIQNALKLFLQQGIRNMTMQKLAAAMGMSTKTLYRFFADKETLLEECLAVHYAGMFADLRDMTNANLNPVEFICTVYAKSTALDFGASHLFYHDLNYYYPQLQDKIIGQHAALIGSQFMDIMQTGVDGGYFLPYLQPMVASKALSVLYTSVTRFDTYKEFNLLPEQVVQHTIDIYLRGMCTAKGLHIIDQFKNSNL